MGGYHIALPSVDEALGIRLIRSALDRGITFIDTSPGYGDAERIVLMHGEEMIGDHPRFFGRGHVQYNPWHYVPALERMESGGVFGNAGSWLDAPTYLRLTDEAIELCEWDGSAQGKCLNSINR